LDDSSSLQALLVISGLLIAHALVTLAFGAISNIRHNFLRELAEDGNKRAAQLLRLVDEGSKLQITYQLALALLKFAIASVAVIYLSTWFIEQFAVAALLAHTLVIILAVSITLTLGELVPEAIGSAYARELALWLSPVIWVLVALLTPVSAVLLVFSRRISQLFASSELVNQVTEEEIMTLVESGHTGGTIEEEEKEMILSVLQLDETHASEVMVPRIDMQALEVDTPLEEARARFISSGFSRIPIYEENIDTICGVLYAKDLLTYWHNGNKEKIKSIRDLMRPAHFVPETMPADELLKDLQKRRVHMAIVVDEYGGTAGLVTIENIIEEIIGDIQDEYDPEEEAEYVEIGVDEYMVDASIDLDDFNDLLDVDLPTEDSDTLGGFIYSYLERVPIIGEEMQYEDMMTLRVETVEGRRIRKVYVVRLRPQTDDDAGESRSDSRADQVDESSTAVQEDRGPG
jgi:putative hemolysin